MPEEEEPDNPEEQEEEQQQEEQQEQEEEEVPVHSCGAELEEGMRYCPGCGDKVDSSAYK